MRQILVILSLIVTLWAVMPGASMAHEMPGSRAMSETCAHCTELGAASDHAIAKLLPEDCNQGAGCMPALCALAELPGLAVPLAMSACIQRPGATGPPLSPYILRDLPPPRA